MSVRRLRLVPALAALLLLLVPALASAQESAVAIDDVIVGIDSTWIMIAAVFVLLMQAGFAMLEVGMSRMKNAGAVAGKIIVNLSISFLVFWAVGFSIAFGDGNGFTGYSGWFLQGGFENFSVLEGTVNIEGMFFFQAVFVAVSLAIVYGAMLDRVKFPAYLAFGVLYVGIIYPIVAHWTWGGGWLDERGFVDYAGSSIVHLQGALAALAGTLVLGARLGKFRNGKAIPIPGHSVPLMILGVLILWIGWMGFNPGSGLAAVGVNFADVAVNTNLAAAAGVLGATLMSFVVMRTLDVTQMGNGAIAGLAAITAPCAFVDPWAAVLIGFVGGGIVPLVVLGLEKMRIDDVVGAIPAHGTSGIWGTLALGLFATETRLTTNWGTENVAGLLYGGSPSFLWVQTYGVLATIAFTGIACYLAFRLIKATIGLRVSEEMELRGLDITEHGMFGYPERFIEVPGAGADDVATQIPPSSSGPSPSTTPAPAS
jgi:ammonium transporter, Amt family